MKRVATRCYLPTTALLLEMAKRYGKGFSCAMSITGTALEQMRRYAPTVLDRVARLVDIGVVELLGETYYHSLSSLDKQSNEFEMQVAMHQDAMQTTFGIKPQVFRNTELIYSDAIAHRVAMMGFTGIIAEGTPRLNFIPSRTGIYRAAGSDLTVIPRNYPLSDEIAFRFDGSNGSLRLTPDSYRETVSRWVEHSENIITIGVDCETFGEHVGNSTGILEFLRELPESFLASKDGRFVTPSAILTESLSDGEYSCPDLTSWADQSKDISTWLGNTMQQRAFDALYDGTIQRVVDEESWRRLQTSDHLYYMSTKQGSDGDVHRYFSPYESPYDAFISFMNSFRNECTIKDVDTKIAL
jgi:alpha-amylase